MREIKYLSPSALAIWENSKDEFYLRYLCETRVERTPQKNYMAIGSAFDAYVKCGLYNYIYGTSDPKFKFASLFEDQVEPQNRDWARVEGKYVFERYLQSGAYNGLLDLLDGAKEGPKFEFSVEKEFKNGLKILGKPDLWFVHRGGSHVVLDWKVRGYCSQYAQSPSKGFQLCRDAFPVEVKQSRSNFTSHKLYMKMDHMGIEISKGYMENTSTAYADQLAIYSWLMGEEVGDMSVVVGIDELICKPAEPRPLIRVAEHRNRVSTDYQKSLFARLETVWEAIQSGYIFQDRSREDSDKECQLLEQSALMLNSDGSDEENFFKEILE